MQGPLEYQVVDESEYTQVVEVERKQRTFGEVMIEDVVAPALAEAATYLFERAIDACAEAMKTKVIPAVKTKSVELIDKAKTAHAERKAVKKTSTVVTKKTSKIKAIEILEKEEKKLQGELARVNGMLANPNFVNKAPEAKLNEEKEKKAKYEQMMEQVTERLAQLQ